jgi:hypothetical protein
MRIFMQMVQHLLQRLNPSGLAALCQSAQGFQRLLMLLQRQLDSAPMAASAAVRRPQRWQRQMSQQLLVQLLCWCRARGLHCVLGVCRLQYCRQ